MESISKTYKVGTLTYTVPTLAFLFFWLLWGDFCFMLMETVVPSLIPLKFKALGAPNTVMGLAMTTIPGAINAICNPVISFRSDRFRSRWGRRIPFIVATLPFLVACLFGLGFSEKIGFWLHAHVGGYFKHMPATTAAIWVAGGMMALFAFFNTFVNSVFWYLFNDVVPEHLLARFMSWFRMVSLASSAVYNLAIFKYAGFHSTEILVGAGIVYLLGFGLMCLKVREGQYPPVPPLTGNRHGVIAAVETYCRECLGVRHYWYIFLANTGIVSAFAASVFSIFFLQSMGLTLEMIGQLAFASSISAAVAIPISGWLADKFHPIRVVIAGLVLQLFVVSIGLIWLVWHPAPHVVFHVLLAINICLSAPTAALIAVMDPPLQMRIFPRERYGQFCSASSMCRSLGGMLAGVLAGVFLDVVASHWGQGVAYRCIPFWSLSCYALVLFFTIRLYRSWKSLGGDAAYKAPLPANEIPQPLSTEFIKCDSVLKQGS